MVNKSVSLSSSLRPLLPPVLLASILLAGNLWTVFLVRVFIASRNQLPQQLATPYSANTASILLAFSTSRFATLPSA